MQILLRPAKLPDSRPLFATDYCQASALHRDPPAPQFDAEESSRIGRENSGLPGGLQFSNDGQLLAVSFETVKYKKGMIKVFDVSSWQVQDDLASECMFCAIRFSPDRRRLANAGNFFGNTYVWDLATQKKVATISPAFGGSSALSFSSDGKLIATADGDGFVRIYNANTATLRGTLTEFLLEPFAVAFSPDGKSVLAGGADKVISVIDPKNGKISRTIPETVRTGFVARYLWGWKTDRRGLPVFPELSGRKSYYVVGPR